MTTTAVRGVDIVSTGTFAASTGVTTITRADLASMLSAGSDPEVGDGPIVIGHVSGMNGPDGLTRQPGDHLGDGGPAYGWVRPTAVRDNPDGTSTLVGDMLGMPAALGGDTLTSAYRRRSAEMAFGITTPSGRKYSAVLTGLALLGAKAPAIRSLSDVAALYAAAMAGSDGQTVQVTMGVANDLDEAITAGVAPELAGRIRAALAGDTGDIPAPAIESDDAHPVGTLTTSTPTRGEPAMPEQLSDEQIRAGLGLAADADIDAAIRGILDARTPAVVPAVPAAPVAPVVPESLPVAAAAGTVALSQATYDQILADAAAGRAARDEQDRQRREGILTAAIAEGRMTPAERETFGVALAANEDTMTKVIASLQPRFGTVALGSGMSPETRTAIDAELDTWTQGK